MTVTQQCVPLPFATLLASVLAGRSLSSLTRGSPVQPRCAFRWLEPRPVAQSHTTTIPQLRSSLSAFKRFTSSRSFPSCSAPSRCKIYLPPLPCVFSELLLPADLPFPTSLLQHQHQHQHHQHNTYTYTYTNNNTTITTTTTNTTNTNTTNNTTNTNTTNTNTCNTNTTTTYTTTNTNTTNTTYTNTTNTTNNTTITTTNTTNTNIVGRVILVGNNAGMARNG